MGEKTVAGKSRKDRAEKYLEAYPDVFADIVNVLLFGKQVIVPENLLDGPTEAVYKAESGEELLEQRRDISKYVVRNGKRRLLLGLENQSKPDKDMVFRLMGYDYTSYRSQIQSGEKCYPVISVVLYFGEKLWRGPLSISERLRSTPEYENELIDYKIHLIDVPRLPKKIRNQFTSDFRVIADFFASRERADYIPDDRVLDHAEAVLHLLRVFTGDKRYEEIEAEIADGCRKGERFSMCEFAERMERKGIEKGICQGLSQGLSQGRKEGMEEITWNMVKNMLQRGMPDEDICAIAECSPKYVERVRKNM